MSRRVQGHGEQNFGSDSFLDVIANIVGILIILIVIAGVRMGKAAISIDATGEEKESAPAVVAESCTPKIPTTEERAPQRSIQNSVAALARTVRGSSVASLSAKIGQRRNSVEAVRPRVLSSQSFNRSLDVLETSSIPPHVVTAPADPPKIRTAADGIVFQRTIPEDVAPREVAAEPIPVPQHPLPELLAERHRVQNETQRYEFELAQGTQHQRDMEASIQAMEQRLKQAFFDEKRVTESVVVREKELVLVRDSMQQTASRLDELKRSLADAEKVKGRVESIRHRVTAVGRVVEGRELHFVVTGGKVAVLPIDALTERLKAQITRQRDWLIKQRKHEGEVGPVNGFRMAYVVERQGGPSLNDLRSGQTFVRIGLAGWKIIPDANFPAETETEALHPHSAFIRELRGTDAGVTLTFWVYPDSFVLFRKLQKFSHEQGFVVAGRPLPFGVPIAGSPKGSRSNGQ